MTSFIRTVLGDIDPGSLGSTLIHEHLYTAPPAYVLQDDPDLEFGTLEGATSELMDFAAVGGGAMCELTTVDYGRDVGVSIEAARRSGVHVIQATGYQKGIYYPAGTTRRSVDALAAQFAADITDGIDGTDARAGLVKIGTCSTEAIWEIEKKVLRAAARAAARTGAPVLSHTQSGFLGHEQVDICLDEGLDPDQICIGHVDRNLEWDYLESLMARGVWLALDQWTKDKYGSDEGRADMVHRLADRGWDRVMVSGDLGRLRYQPAYGGSPGFGRCLTAIESALKDEATIRRVLIDNPSTFLQFRKAVS